MKCRDKKGLAGRGCAGATAVAGSHVEVALKGGDGGNTGQTEPRGIKLPSANSLFKGALQLKS